MHPLILLAGGSGLSSSFSIDALIGAGAVVLAAALPALLSRHERAPREVAQLRRDQAAERQRMERDREECERDRDRAVTALHDLQRFVWLLGYDPETHQRIGGNGPDPSGQARRGPRAGG